MGQGRIFWVINQRRGEVLRLTVPVCVDVAEAHQRFES